ncbi:MAG TPA: hypothetical protein VGN34_09015, partial [Ktedonobacteraceae bacterium]
HKKIPLFVNMFYLLIVTFLESNKQGASDTGSHCRFAVLLSFCRNVETKAEQFCPLSMAK